VVALLAAAVGSGCGTSGGSPAPTGPDASVASSQVEQFILADVNRARDRPYEATRVGCVRRAAASNEYRCVVDGRLQEARGCRFQFEASATSDGERVIYDAEDPEPRIASADGCEAVAALDYEIVDAFLTPSGQSACQLLQDAQTPASAVHCGLVSSDRAFLLAERGEPLETTDWEPPQDAPTADYDTELYASGGTWELTGDASTIRCIVRETSGIRCSNRDGHGVRVSVQRSAPF
jgi:hypothetical protein